MSELSPAAQAVLDAYRTSHLSINNLAAALRAAADRVKRGPDHWNGSMPDDYDLGWNDGVRYLLAIAAELDDTQLTSGGDFDR